MADKESFGGQSKNKQGNVFSVKVIDFHISN